MEKKPFVTLEQVKEMAASYPTPFHLYDEKGIRENARKLKAAFAWMRDRKHLSEDGLVIIVATVDSKTGKVLAGPDLVSRGFVYVRENESLMDGAQSIVENALERCVDEHVRDWNSVKTRVREALSSYIYRRTKRSPMILPILMEV